MSDISKAEQVLELVGGDIAYIGSDDSDGLLCLKDDLNIFLESVHQFASGEIVIHVDDNPNTPKDIANALMLLLTKNEDKA